MGSFKRFEETDSIERRFINKTVVYLESEDDAFVLRDRWFFDIGERLEFHTVDDEGSGGCTHVIRKVEEDREKGLSAFGIVDRDALLHECNWELFFETDDEAFDAARPFGNEVTVLHRWELENYLLDPEVVNDQLSDATDGKQRSLHSTTRRMLECVDVLTPQIAANLLLHARGRKALPGMFGNTLKTAQEMDNAVREHFEKGGIESYEADFSRNVRHIENFCEDQPRDTPQRWERQNRIIDGKLFLSRFFRTMHGLEDEQRFHLATRIRAKGRIDPEIRDHINRILES